MKLRARGTGTFTVGPDGLGLDDDELAACVACGLCLPHCPTYRVTGLEIASPRGRIAAMQAVQVDGAPIDAAFERYMNECVQCRGCEAACPSSVPFGHLMEGTRSALAQRAPTAAKPLQRVLEWVGYRVVLPRHRLLLALTWIMIAAQKLRVLPARLGMPDISIRELRQPLTPRPPQPGVAHDAYLFIGCVMDAWQREVHRAAIDVAEAAGARLALPARGGACCGALHTHAGRSSQARTLAKRVMASMPGDAPIIVDSAGCGAAMKEYGRLLATPEAERFSARVVDFSAWLVARGVPPLRNTGRTIVVQDPCHLRHVQRAHLAVREALSAAYTVRETQDDGLCCGAGGVYSLTQPILAAQIRDRKVAALLNAAGSEDLVVASANPGCLLHLRGAGLRVEHPAVLIAQALEHHDV